MKREPDKSGPILAILGRNGRVLSPAKPGGRCFRKRHGADAARLDAGQGRPVQPERLSPVARSGVHYVYGAKNVRSTEQRPEPLRGNQVKRYDVNQALIVIRRNLERERQHAMCIERGELASPWNAIEPERG